MFIKVERKSEIPTAPINKPGESETRGKEVLEESQHKDDA